MKTRSILVALAMAGALWAQTVVTDLGEVADKSGDTLSLSRGPTIVFFSLEDSDEPVASTIGLSPTQVGQLQGYLAKAYNGRYLGKGKSAQFGSIRTGNSEISVLVTQNTVSLMVTEGRLDRFLTVEGSVYNKLQALLSKGSGKKAATVKEPVQPRQPRQPSIEGPAYPTHP